MIPGEAFHLVEELDLQLSPEVFSAAFPAHARSDSRFILEGGGAAASPHLDRYAFMGAEPVATFRATRLRADGLARDRAGRAIASVVTTDRAGDSELKSGDPFEALRDFLASHAPARGVFDARFPFPFRAGLIGYVGYECGQFLERLPCAPRPSNGMPDMAFAVHRWLLATSRATDRSWLSVLGSGASVSVARADAQATRDRILTALAGGRERGPAPRRGSSARSGAGYGAEPHRIDASLSPAEYIERVAIAKDHITRGDAFEICLTNALQSPFPRNDAWELFAELRRSNPAPFAALLELPEGVIVSSSPERFLSLDADGFAESRPIKGTRPRGGTPESDARLVRELETSEKDRAENAMIVDLVRNDFGRVCRFGTVEASNLFTVETYATVHQLVSTVSGALESGNDGIDLLRACFPPGSMTGAPKIEAMTILERLERVERGVYSGALGWIDLEGAMDLSVVIRTAVIREGIATFSVGGAIVADSDPAAEHQEAEHKAYALVRALADIDRRRPDPHA